MPLNPLGIDLIDWDHPRPWGGGNKEWRSIRLYYGALGLKATGKRRLTTADIAWGYVDDLLPLDDYLWDWAIGQDVWLYPCGFSTIPYARALTEKLKDNHVHYVYKVDGWNEDILDLVESEDPLVISAGKATRMHKHQYL
jgi:hypothetical protein